MRVLCAGAGEWTDEARGMAAALILQHSKHEKLPSHTLEFRTHENQRWTVDRAEVESAQPIEAVKV